jgi:hypothetical protein
MILWVRTRSSIEASHMTTTEMERLFAVRLTFQNQYQPDTSLIPLVFQIPESVVRWAPLSWPTLSYLVACSEHEALEALVILWAGGDEGNGNDTDGREDKLGNQETD